MSTTIDSLQIEIQTSSSDAAGGIQRLVNALGRLKKVGSYKVATDNIKKLADSLRELQGVSGAGSNLESIAKAVEGLKAAGSFGTIASNFKTLSKSISELNSADINAFAAKIKELNDKISPVSGKLVSIGNAFKVVNTSAKSTSGSIGNLGKKINITTLNMSSMINVIRGVVSALRPVANLIKNAIGDASELEGVAQRFGRGFGEQAQETYEWIQKLNKEMGINTQQFMQYSSTYATMLKGFGVASEDASKMALGYMELTYDIWAGYNDIYESLDDAATAVRSAIAGEVEPVRKAGFTIIESTLEQTAANHGLKISLEKATEAQKSYLRYLALVDQANAQKLVGNYAREMNTAEGVMRTFNQQVKSLGQSFGSVFLPVLVKIMPWFQAFIDLLGDAVIAAANFFNIDIQKVNFGDSIGASADGATDSVNDTTDALKELKNATTGIDELNIISPQSASGSSAVSGSGTGFEGFDIDSLWDDSIFDSVQFEVDKIKGKLEEALIGIEAVISTFSLGVGTILAVSGASIPKGIALMAIGAAGLIPSLSQNWNGMSEKLAKTLTAVTAVLAGFLLAVGAVLAFTGVNPGLGIGLMVAGAVSLGTSVSLNWKYLNGDMENTMSILTGVISGALLAVGALFAFTGAGVGLGIALMVAGAVGLAATVGLNWDSMPTKVKKIIADLVTIVSVGAIAIGAMLAFSGANVLLGMALLAAGAVGLVAAGSLNWDSTTNKVKQTMDTLTLFVSSAMMAIGAVLAFSGVNIPLGVALLAGGTIGLVSTKPINTDGIVTVIKNVLKEIGIAVGASLLAIGVLLCLTGVGIPLGIGLIVAGVAGIVSGVALNWDAFKDIGKRCVDGIVSGFSGLGDSAKKIFDDFIKSVKNFLGIHSPSKSFEEIGNYCMQGMTNAMGKNSIKDALVNAWNTAKKWWNDNVKLSIPSLSFKVTYSTTGLNAVQKAVVKALGMQGWPKLSFAKNGGIFDTGSLVWAGEAGPEVLAKAAGGKTGVMNVQQMSEAVYEGVYSAVVAAMRSSGGNSGSQDVNVYLDGKQIYSSMEQHRKERGATIMGNQVYAY